MSEFDEFDAVVSDQAEAVRIEPEPDEPESAVPHAPALKGDPMETIAEAVSLLARANADQPVRQMHRSKVVNRTPWYTTEPGGQRVDKQTGKAVKFDMPTYINNYRVFESVHTDEEVRKLNALKPGRYHGDKWQVITVNKDGQRKLLSFPNKTDADRIELAQITGTRGLAALLDIILREQEGVVAA